VAVTDAGGTREPAIRRRDETDDLHALAEGGRGLALVAACSSRWGYRDADADAGADAGAGADADAGADAGAGAGRIVWAEATWPVLVPAAR
jgi:hypothetical protein